jgi:hypothetical protein
MDTALFESHLKFPVCENEILTHDRKACPLGIAQKEIIWMVERKRIIRRPVVVILHSASPCSGSSAVTPPAAG